MNNIKKNVEKKFKRNIEFPFILLVLILHFLLHYATICTLLQLIVTLKKYLGHVNIINSFSILTYTQ